MLLEICQLLQLLGPWLCFTNAPIVTSAGFLLNASCFSTVGERAAHKGP